MAHAAEMVPADLLNRRWQAYRLRRDAAIAHSNLPLPSSPTNGDKATHPTTIASFTKGLPHNDLGEREPTAYGALFNALTTGQSVTFDAIPYAYGSIARSRGAAVQSTVDDPAHVRHVKIRFEKK